jgi:hypothetical protein
LFIRTALGGLAQQPVTDENAEQVISEKPMVGIHNT